MDSDHHKPIEIDLHRLGDVNVGLVTQQLAEVAIREARTAANADRLRGRQGVGGESVDQFHCQCLFAELDRHRALRRFCRPV
jgi:hypothetical protein